MSKNDKIGGFLKYIFDAEEVVEDGDKWRVGGIDEIMGKEIEKMREEQLEIKWVDTHQEKIKLTIGWAWKEW